MTGEVIKSFLVGLGFGVDDASLSKFNKSIASASLRVTALYASTKLAAAGIVAGIAKISEGFEQMGYEYRIIAPAINKALLLRRELLKAYSAAGINITKVIQDSVKLNFSLAKTKFAFEAIYRSVASRFFDVLTKQSDSFRQKIYANMPKIQAALERFIKFVFKAVEATTELGYRLYSILSRVYDFFASLDKATDGWSTIVLGLVAAWQLLNLSFLATPLGMVLAGLVAILALYDDFKTFKEGGKSFFDWTDAIPIIDAVTSALTSMWEIIQSIAQTIAKLVNGDIPGALVSLTAVGDHLLSYFSDVLALFTGFQRIVDNLVLGAGKLLGINTSNLQANLASVSNGAPATSPLGSNVQNSQTNQNVNQQTQINVQGVPDAKAVGSAVSSQQEKVNFDLVRNLKPRVR